MQFPRKRCSGWPTLFALSKIAVLLLLAFPVQAAAFWPFSQERAPVVIVSDAAALRTEIQGLSNELFRNLADADPANGDLGKGVMVCTFVELKKLSRTSSLGRYVAEQLMNEMQQRHYEVVEIRKSQAVMLQEKRGEFGLSRNPAEVSQTVAAGAMLIGTYTPSKDSIVINARIIDNRNAKLLSSATAIIPRNKLAEQLLADTASVREEKPEPLYLKKLEL
ncbi:MAG: FlgO family outer membrane protein [Desulfurivibrionaceae bacterium]|jgi:TolB-like protein